MAVLRAPAGPVRRGRRRREPATGPATVTVTVPMPVPFRPRTWPHLTPRCKPELAPAPAHRPGRRTRGGSRGLGCARSPDRPRRARRRTGPRPGQAQPGASRPSHPAPPESSAPGVAAHNTRRGVAHDREANTAATRFSASRFTVDGQADPAAGARSWWHRRRKLGRRTGLRPGWRAKSQWRRARCPGLARALAWFGAVPAGQRRPLRRPTRPAEIANAAGQPAVGTS